MERAEYFYPMPLPICRVITTGMESWIAADYVTWRRAVATQNLAADGNRDGVVGDERLRLVV